MSDTENEKTEETEETTPEAVVAETPAAEETAPEPEAAEKAPEPEAAVEEPASVVEDGEAPAAEAAPAAVAEPAEPVAPAKQKKSLKHIPRTARRTRTKTKREPKKDRAPITRLAKPEHDRGRRQERRGVVVSDSMDKTIVVKVESVRAHQRYKKVIRRTTKFHAHDEQNTAHVGDVVRIIETRPLSKTKNWRLAEVIEVAK